MATRLSADARTAALSELDLWSAVLERDAIQRTFTFKNFNQAFGFMTRVALLAEKMDHHPEWSNVWNRVEVVLSTHDVGGLSELDLRMARAMDQIAAQVAEAPAAE